MLGCGTTAGPVAQTFGAFHGADESRFLQQAVAAHTAAEKRTFNGAFEPGEDLFGQRTVLEGSVGGLPAAGGGESGHYILREVDGAIIPFQRKNPCIILFTSKTILKKRKRYQGGINLSMRIPFTHLDQKAWIRLAIFAVIGFYIAYIGASVIKHNTFIGLGADMLAFWSAGKVADIQGFDYIYNIESLRATQNAVLMTLGLSIEKANTIPAPLPAFFLIPFQFLSRLSPVVAYWGFTFFSLIGSALYLWFFIKQMKVQSPTTISNSMLWLLMLFSYPIFQNFFSGQVEIVHLICCGEFIRNSDKKKPFLAGLWLGGMLIKPQVLILIIPGLLLLKNWKVLYGFAVSSFVILGASLALTGMDGMITMINLWLKYVPGIATNSPETMMNWRMIGIRLSEWINSSAGWIIAIVGMLVTVLAVLLLIKSQPAFGSKQWFLIVFALFAATCTVTWHSHVHMAMVLIPFIVYIKTAGYLQDRLLYSWVLIPPLLMIITLVIEVILQMVSIPPIYKMIAFVSGLCEFIFCLIFVAMVRHQLKSAGKQMQ